MWSPELYPGIGACFQYTCCVLSRWSAVSERYLKRLQIYRNTTKTQICFRYSSWYIMMHRTMFSPIIMTLTSAVLLLHTDIPKALLIRVPLIGCSHSSMCNRWEIGSIDPSPRLFPSRCNSIWWFSWLCPGSYTWCVVPIFTRLFQSMFFVKVTNQLPNVYHGGCYDEAVLCKLFLYYGTLMNSKVNAYRIWTH